MRKKRTIIANPLVSNTFHITTRCVRKNFLLDDGKPIKRPFKSRRHVILKRLQTLASAYAIDILRVSFMDNHAHFEVRNRPDLVDRMSDEEVARRHLIIHPGYCQANADAKNKSPDKPTLEDAKKLAQDKKKIAKIRQNLSSISRFMQSFNFYTSRYFNIVDGKSGAFWESRYKLKALLDELSIFLCALYIDLNPIRAGIALTPETSRFTSAYYQIEAERMLALNPDLDPSSLPNAFLAPVCISSDESRRWTTSVSARASDFGFTAMTSEEYLILLDMMGRILHKKQKGAIPADLPPIFRRLNLTWERVLNLVSAYEELFCFFVGSTESLTRKSAELGGRRLRCPAADMGLLP